MVLYYIHKLIITPIPEIVGCYPFHVEKKKWKTFSNQTKAGGGDSTVLYSPNSDREPFIITRRRKIKLSHSILVIHLCILHLDWRKKFIKFKKK